MQVKSEVFFSFRKFGRFLFGEPLVGVGDPTVGADLCVRLSSPERSLFCGADTQVRPYTNHINKESSAIRLCNPDLRRGGPVCPPVLIGAQYALWGGHAGPPLHKPHQHDKFSHQTL